MSNVIDISARLTRTASGLMLPSVDAVAGLMADNEAATGGLNYWSELPACDRERHRSNARAALAMIEYFNPA